MMMIMKMIKIIGIYGYIYNGDIVENVMIFLVFKIIFFVGVFVINVDVFDDFFIVIIVVDVVWLLLMVY